MNFFRKVVIGISNLLIRGGFGSRMAFGDELLLTPFSSLLYWFERTWVGKAFLKVAVREGVELVHSYLLPERRSENSYQVKFDEAGTLFVNDLPIRGVNDFLTLVEFADPESLCRFVDKDKKEHSIRIGILPQVFWLLKLNDRRIEPQRVWGFISRRMFATRYLNRHLHFRMPRQSNQSFLVKHFIANGAKLLDAPLEAFEIASSLERVDIVLILYVGFFLKTNPPATAHLLIEDPVIFGCTVAGSNIGKLKNLNLPCRLSELLFEIQNQKIGSKLGLGITNSSLIVEGNQTEVFQEGRFSSAREALLLVSLCFNFLYETKYPKVIWRTKKYWHPRAAANLLRGSDPSFSIVVPFHTHRLFFGECLRSLEKALRQIKTLSYEVIVVNDDPNVSTSDLELVVPGSIKDRVWFPKHKPGSGITSSLNLGIGSSKYNWIVFLDCDDLLFERAFRVLVSNIEKFPTARYITSNVVDVNEAGQCIRFRTRAATNNDLFYLGNVAGHLKAIRSDAFKDLGMLDRSFDGCQDYEFALRLGKCEPILFLADYLYKYRWHRQSQSSSKALWQRSVAGALAKKYAEL